MWRAYNRDRDSRLGASTSARNDLFTGPQIHDFDLSYKNTTLSYNGPIYSYKNKTSTRLRARVPKSSTTAFLAKTEKKSFKCRISSFFKREEDEDKILDKYRRRRFSAVDFTIPENDFSLAHNSSVRRQSYIPGADG